MSGEVLEKKIKKRQGRRRAEKETSWETVWECLFVCLGWVFVWMGCYWMVRWDLFLWLDGLDLYVFYIFESPLFWTLPPTWTQYVEAYGHPLKGPRKINIKYIKVIFDIDLRPDCLFQWYLLAHPPKTLAKMNRAHFDALRMLFQQGGCFPATPIRYFSTFTRLQIRAYVVLGLFVVYSLFTSFCRDTSCQARPFCRENALG